MPFTAPVGENENSNKAINFEKKDNIGQYSYADKSLFNIGTKEGIVIENDAWRIYEGSTPILNAFLPNAKDYFDEVVKSGKRIERGRHRVYPVRHGIRSFADDHQGQSNGNAKWIEL